MEQDQSEKLTDLVAAEEAAKKWQMSVTAKAGFIFAGVVLPTACFCIASVELPIFNAQWQSGELSDYCRLLFSLQSCLPFYPFLLYAMVCMSCMVFWPERSVRRFAVRFGVYTGVAISLQYCVLLPLSCGGWQAIVILVLGSTALFWSVWEICSFDLGNKLKDRQPAFFRAYILPLAALFVVLCAMVLFLILPPLFIIVPLYSATFWSVFAYSIMSLHLFRRNGRQRWQFSLAQLFVLVTWLAAFCSAWRMSVTLMLAEYAKLPVAPPKDCYVCTAAARGHRPFVGSASIGPGSGDIVWINDQTRYLKAAEIALAATWPLGHRIARAVYDRLGPPAAGWLTHPLAADAAYLAMKPAEWAARAFFATALPGTDRLIKNLYRR